MGRFTQDATETAIRIWEATGMSEADILDSIDVPPDQIEILDAEDYPHDSEKTLTDTDRLGFSDLDPESRWDDLCNPSPDLQSLPFDRW